MCVSSSPYAPAFGFAPTLFTIRAPPPLQKRRRLRTPLSRKAACRAALARGDDNLPPRDDQPTHAPIANLHELTERISHLLDAPKYARSTNAHETGDERLGHLNASLHIVVVFGKRLIRDQVSVEYAKRIVTLVKQLATGAIDPDVISFTGGRAADGCVSEASAGYTFFRSICEEARLDVTKYSYLLEEKSANTAQNVQNVIGALRRRCEPAMIANCHFTLVSSDYHLIRLQEVYRLNSLDSPLHTLRQFNASWSYIFAAYPFCVSGAPATAFLGRAVVLANDLSIVLVNINCAVSLGRFVARENLHRLQETFAKMREMCRIIDARSNGFNTDMRAHAETLELAIHRVREVNTILLPLHEDGGSVSKEDLQLAQRLLMSVVRDIRESMDPDRTLLLSDRLAVADDLGDEGYNMQGAGTGSPQDGNTMGGGADGEPKGESDGAKAKANTGKRRPRTAARQHSADGITSELAATGGARFMGNGKRIARDGPNVVVVEAGATGSTLNILEELAAHRGEAFSALLDEAEPPKAAAPVKAKRPRGRPVGSTTTRTLRAAATAAATPQPQPARKRRGRTPAKRKAAASNGGDGACA